MRLLKDLSLASLPVLVTAGMIVAWTFPYATDDPLRREDAVRDFYNIAMDPVQKAAVLVLKPTVETQAAEDASEHQHVPDDVRRFVRTHHLERGRVLEVGSGHGSLQDVVGDYTGLDIAASVAHYYHKPFVVGTATAMPFPDQHFDAVWSIWVLEHIPNPEAALREIRRVVKPGGYIYLRPAFDVPHWASRGLDARPYAELGWRDRVEKATLPVRRSQTVWVLAHGPMRLIRSVAPQPTTLHYRRLTPNYRQSWQADSDAVNDLDYVEVERWFESRGDRCVNCGESSALDIQIGPTPSGVSHEGT